MQYFSVILAVMTGSVFVSAAPSQGDTPSARACGSDYSICGSCSGGSCRTDGIGIKACQSGSCSSDGSTCGVKYHAFEVTCT